MGSASLFPESMRGGNPLTPERVRTMSEEWERAFLAMSEDEQIATRACGSIHVSYATYDPTGKPREETARESLTKSHGPKFADRALADPRLRRILKVDDPPLQKSEVCTD